MKKLKIIGCGSLLMGDDAVGCVIARELQKMVLPENVEVIEAGTPGLNLLNLMEPDDDVLIVDAIVTGSEAGSLYIFSGDELPKPGQMPLSAHQVAIPETIELGKQVQPELMPKSITIWGIEIKPPVVMKFEMSETISKVVPGVLEKLVQEIEKRMAEIG